MGIANSILVYSAHIVPREPWSLSLIFGMGAHIEIKHGLSHFLGAASREARNLPGQVLEPGCTGPSPHLLDHSIGDSIEFQLHGPSSAMIVRTDTKEIITVKPDR